MIPGLGRSPGEGKGYSLQDSGLENCNDYCPWAHKKSDMTERLSLSLSLKERRGQGQVLIFFSLAIFQTPIFTALWNFIP